MTPIEDTMIHAAERFLAHHSTAAVAVLPLADGKIVAVGAKTDLIRMLADKDQIGAAVRGEAVAESQRDKAIVQTCQEAARKLLTYAQIYTGDKQACRLVEELTNIARALDVSARAADAPSELPTEILAKVMTRDDFNCSTDIGYAQLLAWAVWLKSYRAVSPDFTIMNNIKGVLSQIDNMVCGLSRAADALDSQPTALAITPHHIELIQDMLIWPVTEDDARTARDMLQELHFDLSMASSQPTDGGVRNG